MFEPHLNKLIVTVIRQSYRDLIQKIFLQDKEGCDDAFWGENEKIGF